MTYITQFQKEINDKGWFIVKNAISPQLIKKLKSELYAVNAEYKKIQYRNGVGKETENAMHHTVVMCPSTLELLDTIESSPIHSLLTCYFDGKYILNTLGGSIVKPHTKIYTQNIHRDVRSNFGRSNLTINTVVMLDDSTIENGCTWMYSGSHLQTDKPDKETFYSRAERAPCKAGDIILFDGNIWHAAGNNTSTEDRALLTPIYSKPLMKQQLDYPRAFGYDFSRRISPELKQVLGYNALTPVTIDEFYKPLPERFYKQDQG
jgi:ectoine hydroxylase-related dioxygenase (phytanoyl-CoA dioxygenase family)